MLFDWLVVGHVLEVNPAHAVRGPKYSVKKGKTRILDREDARKLIASIEVVKTKTNSEGVESEEPDLVGLRDRALIGVMIYTFARVGAARELRYDADRHRPLSISPANGLTQ
jgi:integrase/recombinase XerD